MATKHPNIVYILADDMGFGDPGCYGATKIPTPHMDRIAREGMMFMDAHSASAVCTPSRYSILSGQYCWRTQLKSWVLAGLDRPFMEPGRPTVASFLKDHGYATAATGKWHLGMTWFTKDGTPLCPPRSAGEPIAPGWDENGFTVDYTHPIEDGPTTFGFDYFFGIAGSLDMPPYCFIENDRVVGTVDREKDVYYNQQRIGMQTPDWKDEEVDITFAKKAVSFMEEQTKKNPDQPFFLYVPTASPHRPCDICPDIVKGKSTAGDRGDMVALFDWVVGEVLDALDRLGIADETIVMVTSDNGGHTTCANGESYGHKTNGDWRGKKADIWDGGHREPLLVRWPGRVAEGSKCEQLVCLSDFFATVAEIVGSPLPGNAAEDSFSYLPGMLQDDSRLPVRDHVIHHSGGGMFSLREGDWKLCMGLGSWGFSEPKVEEPVPGGPGGQLYNLADDPAETTNLWLEKPEIVERMRARLEACQNAPATRVM